MSRGPGSLTAETDETEFEFPIRKVLAMLLLLTTSTTNWTRLATLLDATASPVLATVVRALLAGAPTAATGSEPVSLAFTPQQTGELQRTAASLGLSLPATPVLAEAEPDAAAWVTPAAERAAAVAVADALIRAHQRQRPQRRIA